MPMPALTLNNVSIGVPFIEEKKINEMKKATIGSFRNNIDIKTLLPPNLYSSIFDPVPDNLDIKNLITVPNNQVKHFLNNAAFGRAFDDVPCSGGFLSLIPLGWYFMFFIASMLY